MSGLSDEDRQRLAREDTVQFGGEGEGEDVPLEVSIPEKYRVERVLGRGGFGVVYLARDTVLDRRVALKFLTEARPADVARLRREARFTARLDAQGIVKIYELGHHEGQFYIAMQFILGSNLRDAELDREELVRVMRSVAIALQHAHDEGIVHRDIKPENILLDTEGRPYVTDFGIARDVRGRGGGTEGLVVGTPDLMPPEQARGQSSKVDARSDVYSLGASLYAMLTGRRPFTKPTLVETLYAAIHESPIPPRTLDPSIPRGLQAIILRCMCKDPAERYQSMAHLVDAFDRYLGGGADPSESGGRFLAIQVPALREPRPDLALAIDLAREISTWDTDLYRVSRDITRTFPALEAVVEQLDDVLAEHPDYAWARFYRGMALVRLGRLPEALDDMERSVDRLGDRTDEGFGDAATAQFELGRLYLRLGVVEQQEPNRHLSFVADADHFAVTEGYLEQAVIAFQEARRLKAGLAPWQVLYAQAVRSLAAKRYAKCITACDEILSEDEDVEEVWKLRGDALQLSGGDPVECYRRAVEVRRSYYEAHHALAEALVARGEDEEAAGVLARALAVHPSYVPSLVLRARLHLERAPDREALSCALSRLEKARELDPLDADLKEAYAAAQTAGRSFVEAAWIDQALQAIKVAREQPELGQDRDVLAARALLFRARHALAFGEDPRPDLDELLRRASPEVDESGAEWMRILEAAFRRRSQGG